MKHQADRPGSQTLSGLPALGSTEGGALVILVLVGLLVLIWLAGFALNLVGDLIHIVLAVAVVAVVYWFLQRRKTA